MTLRLHLNENTGGCSPAVLASLRELAAEDIAQYPDYTAVTADCARWLGVPETWVQLTNGLDEGIQILAQQAALSGGRGFEAMVVEPAFEMYARFAEAAGGTVVSIPPRPDFGFPLEEILARLSSFTRVVYLTDPNNPTGMPIPAGAFETIALAAPQALVLVDEAYGDFSRRTVIGPALGRLRNVVVGRTFAKAHGLAGLRVGVLIAHPSTLEPLRRILPPYSSNICAVRALSAALRDRAYTDEYVDQSRESKALIYDFCERHGIPYWRSEANFVLLRPGASSMVQQLAARRVFVRDASGHAGCGGCIRITAGRVDDTRRCLSVMEDILATRDDR